MNVVIGIDPGAHGAIAVLDESGDLLEVQDMPSTPEANGRTSISAPLLAGILARTHARAAFCELVEPAPPMQGQPPSPSAAHAVSSRAARARFGLPIVFLTPSAWKRLAEILPGADKKDLARTRALARGRHARISLTASATSIAPKLA